MLIPGNDGEPLPSSTVVLRLVKEAALAKDQGTAPRVNPMAFELSSTERSTNRRLSVYAADLTSPEQAWALTGCKPDYCLVARLNVNEVRAMRPEPEHAGYPGLDVVWEPSTLSDPGAGGHAGITNLADDTLSKVQRRSLRSQLADLASGDFQLLPHRLAQGTPPPGAPSQAPAPPGVTPDPPASSAPGREPGPPLDGRWTIVVILAAGVIAGLLWLAIRR